MKKNLFLSLAALLLFCAAPAFAASGTSAAASSSTLTNVGVDVSSSPSVSIKQTAAPVDPGMGRQFMFSPQLLQLNPMTSFDAPKKMGYNNLPSWTLLPQTLTWEQAERLSKGDVEVRDSFQEETVYQFTTCDLVWSLPMKPLLGVDGRPVLEDGKPVLVPDEAKYHFKGFVYADGKDGATSSEVDAAARKRAMFKGADTVVLVKRTISPVNKASGKGLSLGGGVATLTGAGQTESTVANGGLGWYSAHTEHQYDDGIVYAAYQSVGARHALKKLGLLKTDKSGGD